MNFVRSLCGCLNKSRNNKARDRGPRYGGRGTAYLGRENLVFSLVELFRQDKRAVRRVDGLLC